MSTRAPLTPNEARHYLVSQLRLATTHPVAGARGVRDLLEALRCIQLDPLDPIGTNADLVALARVDGLARGEVYTSLLPGHAFEHFAKERCLLPRSRFPNYREGVAQTGWWRNGERESRVPPAVVEAVYAELAERGPSTPHELTDHGSVEAIDWSGWKGTGRATSMALEVLWTYCRVVVVGRGTGGKRYDIASRALPDVGPTPPQDFPRAALLDRVEAAGLLCRAGGPMWSMLEPIRKTALVDDLIAEGLLEEVRVVGASRPYLAPAGFRDRPVVVPDGRMRILGPLDPLLWDRKLVAHVFGFEYIWEVYKPAPSRRWGWYVCPLLHHGRLVGRLEGRVDAGVLVIDRMWAEPCGVDLDALDEALARHAVACGASSVTRPTGFSVANP